MKRRNLGKGIVVASVVVMVGGCSGDSHEPPADPKAGMRIALSVGPPEHDVTSVRYDVLVGRVDCDGQPVATQTVALQYGPLPGAASQRPFADAFFVLPPDEYTVCATPLTAAGEPSAICGQGRSFAQVEPEQTTEIMLVSNCQGTPNGGLDAVTTFNHPPVIEGVQFTPGKFAKTCEPFTIAVQAADPDGDPLRYSWWVNGPFDIEFLTSPTATFSTFRPGDYDFFVTAYDATSSVDLTFTVHLSKAEGCSEICPPWTIESAGFCWIVGTGYFPVGLDCYATWPWPGGLSGRAGPVPGLRWTPELMAELTSKLGCTNAGVSGCCQSSLWIDRQTNTCFTQGFSGNYVNDMDIGVLNGALPVYACNPVSDTAAAATSARAP